jgi:hypothetical protein
VEYEQTEGFKQEGQFLVHFYLDDGSHQMDALVLHACEGYLLDLFHEIGKQLDVEFRIETRAHPEGGLQVWLTTIGKHAAALTVVGGTVAALITGVKWVIYDRPLTLQQQEMNELTLKKMRLELKRLETEAQTKAPATESTRSLNLEPPPPSATFFLRYRRSGKLFACALSFTRNCWKSNGRTRLDLLPSTDLFPTTKRWCCATSLPRLFWHLLTCRHSPTEKLKWRLLPRC